MSVGEYTRPHGWASGANRWPCNVGWGRGVPGKPQREGGSPQDAEEGSSPWLCPGSPGGWCCLRSASKDPSSPPPAPRLTAYSIPCSGLQGSLGSCVDLVHPVRVRRRASCRGGRKGWYPPWEGACACRAAAGWSGCLVTTLRAALFIQNWLQVNRNLKIHSGVRSRWLKLQCLD